MYPAATDMDAELPDDILMNDRGEMMMSFLNRKQRNSKRLIQTKTSLRAYPQNNPLKSHNLMKNDSKRMSSFPLCMVEGSMSVEASLVIPIFLFAVVNLLSVILIFGEYSTGLATLHQEAKELAVYAHTLEGEADVSNDMIIRTKVQKIEPLIPLIGFSQARTIINCRARKWTGYDVEHKTEVKEEEEWVYITAFGSAYHRRRDCSYLNLSLHCTAFTDIKTMKNAYGERYLSCERCGNDSYTGVVFYTEQGNRYHRSLACSTLKRTVESVPISQVNGRHACSRCGSN